MTDVTYDLDAVKLIESENPYFRFLDLLPVLDADLLPLGARATPTIHAEALGTSLGLPHLYLKNETVLPTASTKDRMAAIALPYLYECGVERFATSSTGNSSSAYAHAIARIPGMTMYIFTAEQFRDRVTLSVPPNPSVIDVLVEDATFVDAFTAAGEFAHGHAVTSERGFFNPGRREGLKVAWLEAVEQVPRPIDWYVQAVSSAMGVFGIDKAARELHQLGLSGPPPRLLCVQEDTCAPMVSAWRDGTDEIRPEHVVAQPRGIAAAIQRGDPSRAYPHVNRIVRRSGGAFAAVSEAEIREARDMVLTLEGVPVCFAAAAAVAGLAQWRRTNQIAEDQTVLVNLTGGERSGSPVTGATRRITRKDGRWDFRPLELDGPA
jgi:threonine synthase